MAGFCPNCGAGGEIGTSCSERSCALHGYQHIPEELGRKQLQAGLKRDALVGRAIEEYLVVDKLGEGGFGVVYKTLQMPIQMETALKLLKSTALAQADSGPQLEKFRQEARALAKLTHPNIVRLIKYGVFESTPYMVMEFVKGATELRQEIKARKAMATRFTPDQIRHIMTQVLNALSAAHDEGLIHRDIKPENIMLQPVKGDDYFVRILDFGLAKFLDDAPKTSLIQGTPIYMAPEQFLGKNIGPWTDLYAVALILYELLTGETVFDGSDTSILFRNKMDPSFDPVRSTTTTGLPQPAVDFIRKAAATAAECRFQTPQAFQEAMARMFHLIEKGEKAATTTDFGSLPTDLVDADEVKAAQDYLQSRSSASAAQPHQPTAKLGGAAFEEAKTATAHEMQAVLGGREQPKGEGPSPGGGPRPDNEKDAERPDTPVPAPTVRKEAPSPSATIREGGGLGKLGIVLGIVVALLVVAAAIIGLVAGVFDSEDERADDASVTVAGEEGGEQEKEAPEEGGPQPVKEEPKVEAKVDVKPEPKVEAKVDVKPEPKVEAKVDVKPEPKVEAKVDVKPEPKAEAKVDVLVQPEVKPAPDPALEARRQLDELYQENGEPLPPEECRAKGPAEFLNRLATAYVSLADLKADPSVARNELVEMQAQGEKLAEYWVLRAQAEYRLHKDPASALDAATKAGELCPNMAVAANVLGKAWLLAGKLEEARQSYRKAQELAPEYVQPLFNLALVELGAKDSTKALELLDQVIRINPNHKDAFLVRAQARLIAGMTEEAVADLEAVLKGQPENTKALILLGNARAKAGQNEEAMEAYCKAKELGDAAAEALCKR
jgi:serine/threonine-protein kinase